MDIIISDLDIPISQAGTEISSLQTAWTPIRSGKGALVVKPISYCSWFSTADPSQKARYQPLTSIRPRLISIPVREGRWAGPRGACRPGGNCVCQVAPYTQQKPIPSMIFGQHYSTPLSGLLPGMGSIRPGLWVLGLLPEIAAVLSRICIAKCCFCQWV
jgi:hypothetical protein